MAWMVSLPCSCSDSHGGTASWNTHTRSALACMPTCAPTPHACMPACAPTPHACKPTCAPAYRYQISACTHLRYKHGQTHPCCKWQECPNLWKLTHAASGKNAQTCGKLCLSRLLPSSQGYCMYVCTRRSRDAHDTVTHQPCPPPLPPPVECPRQ